MWTSAADMYESLHHPTFAAMSACVCCWFFFASARVPMVLRRLALTACAVCVIYHMLMGTVYSKRFPAHWEIYPWSELRILHLAVYIQTLLVSIATYLISVDTPPSKAGLRTFRSWPMIVMLSVVNGLWVGVLISILLVFLGWWYSTWQDMSSGGIAAFEGGVMAQALSLWINAVAPQALCHHCTVTAQSQPSRSPYHN